MITSLLRRGAIAALLLAFIVPLFLLFRTQRSEKSKQEAADTAQQERLDAAAQKRQAKLEQLAVVAASCRGDADKAACIAGKLELTEGELAQLLGTIPKDRKLKAIMEASQPYRQEREVITLKTRPPAAKRAAAASDEAAEPEKPDVAADRKQKSLFDF